MNTHPVDVIAQAVRDANTGWIATSERVANNVVATLTDDRIVDHAVAYIRADPAVLGRFAQLLTEDEMRLLVRLAFTSLGDRT